MATTKLRKKQLAVIDDLFNGGFDEQAVLEKHEVRINTYNKWLSDELFSAEFARRIAIARLQSKALIAKYSLIAAAKLVELTESQNPETARKACLDIISSHQSAGQKTEKTCEPHKKKIEKLLPSKKLQPQIAGRLLAALAEEKKTISKDKTGQDSKDR